jgi:DNA-binding LytR/AlgR family response regulator
MKYRIGIVDDEKLVCSELERMILQYSKLRDTNFDCEFWTDSNSFVHDLSKGYVPDIIFLDIAMPKRDGIEIGKYIRETLNNQQMQIIYISSETSYAMELFNMHPYDFLIKPINYEKVAIELDKLLRLFGKNSRLYRICYKGEEWCVPWDNIVFIESDNKHLKVNMQDGEIITFVGKLKNETDRMPSYFIRINQSYAVNLKYVKRFKRNEIEIEKGRKFLVSSPYRAALKERIIEFIEGMG